MKIRTLTEAELKNKIVLLRTDFNVPIVKGKIEDEFKMTQSIPTINYLLNNGCKVLVVSHLGRPEGKKVPSLSLKPVYLYLKKLLPRKKVEFCNLDINAKNINRIRGYRGDVVLLENIRFFKGEDVNDQKFSKILSKLADIYVDEAFAGVHRDAASISGVPKYLPAYGGLNVEKEVRYLSQALSPKSPSLAFIGGAKVEGGRLLLDGKRGAMLAAQTAAQLVAVEPTSLPLSLSQKPKIGRAHV